MLLSGTTAAELVGSGVDARRKKTEKPIVIAPADKTRAIITNNLGERGTQTGPIVALVFFRLVLGLSFSGAAALPRPSLCKLKM